MDSKMIFAPVLDSKCKRKNERHSTGYPWMWYKGQRVAHLHKKKLQQSLSRFNYVGYPGTFRQPCYIAYFKNTIVLEKDTLFSFEITDGRVRMNINGKELDITDRRVLLRKGKNSLHACIDFCNTLPALAVTCECSLLQENWQCSLDDIDYSPVEILKQVTSDIHPLDELEDVYEIQAESITLNNAIEDNEVINITSDGSVLVNFGYYELGYVTLSAKGSGEIEIIVGQTVSEVNNIDSKLFEQIQMSPVSISHNTKKITTPIQTLQYALIKCNGSATITDIVFNALITPVEYKGDFSCDDNELEDMFMMGCATVHSCMHSFFLDAIYRDSLPWALDGMGAMMASNLVFDDRLTARNQVISQLLPENAKKKDLGIVYLDFQLYAMLSLEKEYLFTGDINFLNEYKDTIFNTIDIYLSITDDRGYINSTDADGMAFFPDWSAKEKTGPDKLGTPSYAQMLFVKVLEFGAMTASLFNDNDKEIEYYNHAKKLRKNVVYDFYDFSKKAFYNGLDSTGELDVRYSVYAQSFGILYDFVSDYNGCVDIISNHEYKDKSLSIHFPWEVMALAKSGQHKYMIKYLKDICLPIMNTGNKRIYEDINYDGSHTLDFYGRDFGKSLCHSVMGAAPVLGLINGAAGIYPDESKVNTYNFSRTNLSLNYIKCKVPTKDGYIQVEYDKDDIKITVKGSAIVYISHHDKYYSGESEITLKR